MTDLGVVFRPDLPAAGLRSAAETADAAGVEELWLWEDCFEYGGIGTAAAALAWTSRLTVGIGVLPVPLRNPALAAMELAGLAAMFPGRVHVGLGHGVLDWMGQVGARAESPMALLREYTQAVRALLAGETVTTSGRYVALQDVRLAHPPQQPVPVSVGAIKPRTLALAGELGDGVVLTGGSTPDDVRAARAAVDAARAEAGREGPCRLTVYLMTALGPDAADVYAAELARWKLTGAPDELGVAGDAEAVADAVRRWAGAGADAVILQPPTGVDPGPYARVAGEQVRPLLG